ncbi:MAG TPA: hypothetical protein PKG74_03230 [Candidatus Colwellbacteria bacterium]|nr:hypothetical protein [Candidatus Colwellbacteria bacterium]
MENQNLIPNTTPVPHILIRQWMPRLGDVELRILLVVVDQTLGWIEDPTTKRRKEKDWISHSQLAAKTGKGSASISRGLKTLISDHQLIVAVDSKGRLLDTPEKRTKIGRGGKIFYRLNVHAPQLTLFDLPVPPKEKPHQIDDPSEKPHQKKHPFFDDLQKKPDLTKESIKDSMRSAEPTAPENKNIVSSILEEGAKKAAEIQDHDAGLPKKKEPSVHAQFMDFWYKLVLKTRGFKPQISPADGQNLKRVLQTGIKPDVLEKIAVFFLADQSLKKFAPTLATMLSGGILNGLLNRMENDPEFYRNLNHYADLYLPRKENERPKEIPAVEIRSAISLLMNKFKMPGREEAQAYE